LLDAVGGAFDCSGVVFQGEAGDHGFQVCRLAVLGYMQAQESRPQRTLVIAFIASLFALVPLILGLKVLEGARQLRRGVLVGAGIIKVSNWLCSLLAALLISLTLIMESEGTGSTRTNWMPLAWQRWLGRPAWPLIYS
jgi:hypothetical protein